MSNTIKANCTEQEFRVERKNLYHQVIATMLEAAELVGAPQYMRLILRQPKNELMVHFPVQQDDGGFRLYKGYRVQHNNILGPYKGGIRYHRDVRLDDVKSLAVLMTLKCGLIRLPLGGAKGGVQVDPTTLSESELMRLTRRFISALGSNISDHHDIPAPDVGTNAQVMAWAADTAMNLSPFSSRINCLAGFTGKPLEFGGSHGREMATGQGLIYVLEQLLPGLDLQLERLSFSVIGYGNVGSWTARLLTDRGASLRAVLDHTGAILNTNGIDAHALKKHCEVAGGVAGFAGADAVQPDEFYSASVDLLVPAALEQMIDRRIAGLLRCRVIAEGANAPITSEAEQFLLEQGVEILPSILCSSGGVTVSYFEWKQNRQAEVWELSHVDQLLKTHMIAAATRVQQTAARFDCSLHLASHCAALEYMASVYCHRGIFP